MELNWEAIEVIGEIVGAIALIATLGYLAVQNFLQKDLVAAWWNERAAPISGEFRGHIDNALKTSSHQNVRPARDREGERGLIVTPARAAADCAVV